MLERVINSGLLQLCSKKMKRNLYELLFKDVFEREKSDGYNKFESDAEEKKKRLLKID